MTRNSRQTMKRPKVYIFLAPEGTVNSWELRFESAGEAPEVIRGETPYFDNYLPLVRLARQYPVRFVLCTVALKEFHRMPRTLRRYVLPHLPSFASPDINQEYAFRHENLEEFVKYYARSLNVKKWLLVDSTWERRDTQTDEYTSIRCDPEEGLYNEEILKKIRHWLRCQCPATEADKSSPN